MRCQATKKNGEQCGAHAVRGELACAGHLGLGIANDPRAYAQAAAQRAAEVRIDRAEARKRMPRDVYTQALVAHAEELVDRLVHIALNGDDSEALRAIEQLTSRVLGKPKETVEQSAPDRPVELQAVWDMTPEERDELWRRLRAVEEGLPPAA